MQLGIPVNVELPRPTTTIELSLTEASIITAVCRDATHDPRLCALASAPEIVARAEQSVHDLWRGSRVKTFISVLAMRDLHAGLSTQPVREMSNAPRVVRTLSLADRGFHLSADDVLTLSDDGYVD